MNELTKAPADLDALKDMLVGLDRRMSTLEAHVESELSAIKEQMPEDKAAIIVFSGDLDKMIAAHIIATGAATMGLETTLFFTFWGLSGLKERRSLEGKDLFERMMALMTPTRSTELHPSKMAFMGAGAAMLRQMMKQKDVTSLEDLMDLAKEMGVRTVACDMSMEVMGIRHDELRDGVELGGVASFLAEASKARVSLFI
jgi:peroxiredoxin family protein